MNWLIWKEYRLNRLIVVVGLLLIIVPHAVALGVTLWGPAFPTAQFGVPDGPRICHYLLISSLYSLGLCQFVLCLLGGNLIACERVDHSAEFLACLPISRARSLAGKLILTLMVVAAIWIINVSIALPAGFGLKSHVDLPAFADFLPVLGNIALWGFGWFAIGWMLSSFLSSPTFAIAGSLISPFIFIVAVTGATWLFGWPPEKTFFWLRIVGWTVTLSCFVTGSWYYLRRVEP